MSVWTILLIAAAAVIVIGVLVALRFKSNRQHRGTTRLKEKFGSEYGAAVNGVGRKQGEAELAKREERVESFELHPLSLAEADRFTALWTDTQSRFVDDPGGAITDADRLLGEVMQARGYPLADFEQSAADISVNHAEFVENYRAAHALAVRHSGGQTSTEDLRQALVHYRWLFKDLVGSDQPVELVAGA
jgi:hypothetical protein